MGAGFPTELITPFGSSSGVLGAAAPTLGDKLAARTALKTTRSDPSFKRSFSVFFLSATPSLHIRWKSLDS